MTTESVALLITAIAVIYCAFILGIWYSTTEAMDAQKPKESIDDTFDLWAFGYSPSKYGLEALKAWHVRHGDKLKIDPTETIVSSLDKMMDLWREETNAK